MPSKPQSSLVLYGIRNCDTCRKAQSWLKNRGTPFIFHDLREDGLPGDLLTSWLGSAEGANLINRRSTTWRKLTDEEKESVERDPLPVLLANPTLIKRPVVTKDGALLEIGFSPASLELRVQEILHVARI